MGEEAWCRREALNAHQSPTSEMGLALLEVADVIRSHPHVVAFLRHADDETLLDRLPSMEGGREARTAIENYLERSGRRCVGEIDITAPPWREHPTALVPMILSNIENSAPGAGQRRFDRGRHNARKMEEELLARCMGRTAASKPCPRRIKPTTRFPRFGSRHAAAANASTHP